MYTHLSQKNGNNNDFLETKKHTHKKHTQKKQHKKQTNSNNNTRTTRTTSYTIKKFDFCVTVHIESICISHLQNICRGLTL